MTNKETYRIEHGYVVVENVISEDRVISETATTYNNNGECYGCGKEGTVVSSGTGCCLQCDFPEIYKEVKEKYFNYKYSPLQHKNLGLS